MDAELVVIWGCVTEEICQTVILFFSLVAVMLWELKQYTDCLKIPDLSELGFFLSSYSHFVRQEATFIAHL